MNEPSSSDLEFNPEPERLLRARNRAKKRLFNQPPLPQISAETAESPQSSQEEMDRLVPNPVPITRNPIEIANDKNNAILSYLVPMPGELNPSIIRPEITSNSFELKPVMFQMLSTVGQFFGVENEDPHNHLRNSLGVSDTFLIPGVSQEALRLYLFPY